MNNISNLIYTGQVEVKIHNKYYKQFNNGTTHLFKLLTSFLTGEHRNAQELPTNLMIYTTGVQKIIKTPNTVDHINSLLTRNIPINRYTSTITENGVDYETAVYTALITRGYLLNAGKLPDNNITLVLSSNTGKILAAIDLPTDVITSLNNGHSASIKWELSFDNQSTTNTPSATIIL